MRELEEKIGQDPQSPNPTLTVTTEREPDGMEVAASMEETASQVDKTLDKDARVDLQIDWNSLDRRAIFASLRNYDDTESLHLKAKGPNHEIFTLHTTDLKTKNGKALKMEFTKVRSFHNGSAKYEFKIDIVRPHLPEENPLHYVASFDFVCERNAESEEWNMKHRKTERPYRKQGIGDEVLKIAAEIFRNRVADNHLSQSISAKSGQKDLTRWLTNPKRGFMPATNDDARNFTRLNSPNNGLLEVTRLGVTYTFDPEDFMAKFGDKLTGPHDPAVWEDYSYGLPYYYMNSCFRIKLRKVL